MKVATPVVVSFSLLAFASAWAQTSPSQQPSQQSQPQQSQQPPQQQSGQSASQMSADQFIGSKLVDSQGEQLGEIKDVVLDVQGGKIHAVAFEMGGVAGVGAKKFAFPANEIKPGKNKGEFMINAEKQKLENAEGFAKGQWPMLGEEYWGRQEQASAGGTKGPGAQNSNLVKASEMMGKEVSDKSGQQIGEIKDLTLDLTKSQVSNYVVTVKGGGQAQVPPTALSAGTDNKLVLNMDAQQIKQQAKQGQGAGAAGGSSGQQSGSQQTPSQQQSGSQPQQSGK